MAWKILATCVFVFILSFLSLGIFGDRHKHHFWEMMLFVVGIIIPVVVACADIFYLIWR